MKKLAMILFIGLLLSCAKPVTERPAWKKGFTTPGGKFIPKEEIVKYRIDTWGWYGEEPLTFVHVIKKEDAFYFQLNFTLEDGTKYVVRYWYDHETCKIESIEDKIFPNRIDTRGWWREK